MNIAELGDRLLGLHSLPEQLTFVQVSLRGVVVFIAGLIMVRLGGKRILARRTAFDFIMAIVLASVLARAINGSAPFFATLGACFVLVLFHRLVAVAAFHWPTLSRLVKGTDEVIIEDGKIKSNALRRNHFSEGDLFEDLRLARCDDPTKVKCARLERSGELSVIEKE